MSPRHLASDCLLALGLIGGITADRVELYLRIVFYFFSILAVLISISMKLWPRRKKKNSIGS